MNPKRLEVCLEIADDLRRQEAVEILTRAIDAVEQLAEIEYMQSTNAVDAFLGFMTDSLIRLTYLLLSGKETSQQAKREVLLSRACSVHAIDPETLKAIKEMKKRNSATAVKAAAVSSLCNRLGQLLSNPEMKPGRLFKEAKQFYSTARLGSRS